PLNFAHFDCASRVFDRHAAGVAADFGAFAAADDVGALQAGEFHDAERVIDFDPRRQILRQRYDDRNAEILPDSGGGDVELIAHAVGGDLQTDILRDPPRLLFAGGADAPYQSSGGLRLRGRIDFDVAVRVIDEEA